MFRRRQLPPHLQPAFEVFSTQVDQLEAARRALLSCLPVGRVEPAPIEVGLDLLAEVLSDLEQALGGWRHEAVEQEWLDCRAELLASPERIERAHRVAAATGELEELLGAVEDVDEPLGHVFGRAERAFRSLRR